MKMNHILIAMLSSLLFFACDGNTIPPGKTQAPEAQKAAFLNTATVERRIITRNHGAVGTIRPLTETRIESQVSGQVLKVDVVPGTRVKKGQILVTLDSRQLTARLDQAREGLAYAKAGFKQAEKAGEEAKAGLDQTRAAYERAKTLFDKGVVASQKMEIDRAGFLQAKARVERADEGVQAARTAIRQAREVVREAEIALGYAGIKSPADGVVVERLMDPGDLAVPGKPLLTVQTSGALRLEARVREGLIRNVIQGQTYPVEIQTLGHTLEATIEEIVPYADPETRTFMVKAALPETVGVFPGMFGRLLVPAAREEALLVPEAAVVRVGQLEMVNVLSADKDKKGFISVYVKTGRVLKAKNPAEPSKIEVLAGLDGSETLGY